MIASVDLLLQRVLRDGVTGLTDDRIGFQPPDEAWRQRVHAASPGVWINCHLVEIVEHRTLRSNEVKRETVNGAVIETPAPVRLKCSYVVSAWSAKPDSHALPATQLEHDVLGFAARALIAAGPLNPSRVLLPDEVLLLPLAMRDVDLPTSVAPPEGFSKLAELWGTMGRPQAWKPVVEVTVTIPVTFDPHDIGGIVETIIIDTGVLAGGSVPALDADGPVERLVDVGGEVRDRRPPHVKSPVPVPLASVALESANGMRLAVDTTDAAGRFRFGGVVPGAYVLRWWVDGFPPPLLSPTAVTVPLDGGNYELAFTP